MKLFIIIREGKGVGLRKIQQQTFLRHVFIKEPSRDFNGYSRRKKEEYISYLGQVTLTKFPEVQVGGIQIDMFTRSTMEAPARTAIFNFTRRVTRPGFESCTCSRVLVISWRKRKVKAKVI